MPLSASFGTLSSCFDHETHDDARISFKVRLQVERNRFLCLSFGCSLRSCVDCLFAVASLTKDAGFLCFDRPVQTCSCEVTWTKRDTFPWPSWRISQGSRGASYCFDTFTNALVCSLANSDESRGAYPVPVQCWSEKMFCADTHGTPFGPQISHLQDGCFILRHTRRARD